MPNPVVHFEIGCRDREKTNDFYSTLFDWNTSDYGPLSKSINTGSESGINGFMTALGHEPHNYVMVYVEVDNILNYIEKATGLGGSVLIPQTEVPGQGSFAWIKDLDDNTIGLWQPAS